ncbi:RNA polymerase sigma-70 factor [Terrimonas sp.]|uniref:RNA polymerase sigma-70 factor n=1 Tax=Terrimonas sp. TaxID=1914338 RepID=UPI000D51E8CC|nr:RNA polymerase sigma-70 factor [Terrimonas sp.]PVD51204.1 RNA polymerase sigma-70 factor [Terrimonas sp.]
MTENFPDIPISGNDEQYNVAIGCICNQYRVKLYRMALKVVKSPQTAGDIVQNVFLKLWEYRTQLSAIHNIEAWLYRVTKNELIDFLRKTAADNKLKHKLWEAMHAATSDTEEQVDGKYCRLIIDQAVNLLPPQRKLIYTLNRDKGLNYQQIADKLAISKHTVKNHLSLALRSIQQFVSGSMGLILLYLFR